jgi:putative glycosyltransferase (TIGR04348 family)
MPSPSVVIVSPALAAANNGNWQTASRWASFLRTRYRVRITTQWPDEDAAGDTMMIALHARRSATAIAAWASTNARGRLALVLTGTDLYRDIQSDASAQRSLELSGQLVVLQELGLQALAQPYRDKARAIFQSVASRRAVVKPGRKLKAVMVGHLRAVKSPQTLFEAAQLLRERGDIELHHIGGAEEDGWADRARATQATCPNYRWLGPLPHGDARSAIQRAHVLVHTSAMEGGAHVVMEAVCSGTPVLASRVDGNVGMLGAGYGGYFAHGDAAALARLLRTCRDTQATVDPAHGLLAHLRAQCALRAPLFAPQKERDAVLQLVRDLEESA